MCCGAIEGEAHMTIDHIKPRSRYPTLALSPSNMQVLCRKCNEEKDGGEMDYRTDEQIRRLALLQSALEGD